VIEAAGIAEHRGSKMKENDIAFGVCGWLDSSQNVQAEKAMEGNMVLKSKLGAQRNG
jgi:hypothetical protein